MNDIIPALVYGPYLKMLLIVVMAWVNEYQIMQQCT